MTRMSRAFWASARVLLVGNTISSVRSPSSVSWNVSVRTMPSKGSYASLASSTPSAAAWRSWKVVSMLIAAM